MWFTLITSLFIYTMRVTDDSYFEENVGLLLLKELLDKTGLIEKNII